MLFRLIRDKHFTGWNLLLYFIPVSYEAVLFQHTMQALLKITKIIFLYLAQTFDTWTCKSQCPTGLSVGTICSTENGEPHCKHYCLLLPIDSIYIYIYIVCVYIIQLKTILLSNNLGFIYARSSCSMVFCTKDSARVTFLPRKQAKWINTMDISPWDTLVDVSAAVLSYP